MFTIMMLLTGMLSSLSMQNPVSAPAPHAASSAVYGSAVHAAALAPVYPAGSGVEKLNGLSLDDRLDDVKALYGEPNDTAPAYMSGEEYRFDKANVGAYEGWVYYISVPGSAQAFDLNGRSIRMDKLAILAALGQPDFSAEDGFGYEHDGQALKFFIDPSSGDVRSVELFDSEST
ncbi:hypothetical protein QWJ34_23645 [Saccharibacillus sp. CPCC 101409]|uniref:hypothetical protein n=1 Tax=Saccharibacillus sp. CPCC 101409 TaxID=3058041 RepID=UPI0026726D18|nr:hypothetical protein [Saccharibacillus sp. CPCC 101409]MDO3412782.1 hypothetical protein [Saccharibacillus sp. CPCC 101409]